MSMATGFLKGAKDRLLPASVPLRFFLAASLFHVLAWVALFIGADDLPGFAGGPGPVLAAIHLATLGVLTMTAIGAAYQLLPVATLQPLARVWPTRLTFALFAPGVAVLTWGMFDVDIGLMQVGAVLATAGLAVFAVLIGDNLRRVGSLPVVTGHGVLATICLLALAGLGAALVFDFDGGFLDRHADMALLHMVLAGFGFMGVLAIGFSLVLVPMFALSRSLPPRLGWVQLALATAALAAFTLADLAQLPLLAPVAALLGLGAAGTYLWQMRQTLQKAMRKRLGLAFGLIRASWGLMAAALLLGLALALGVPVPNGPALFGFVLVAGWLLTFLTGILQRILPFLASMHAAGKSGLPPLLSELADERPLRVHAACHGAALVLCAGGIVADYGLAVRVGAAIGAVGAVAFVVFCVGVAWQLHRRAGGA
jgi:hypothetical protein